MRFLFLALAVLTTSPLSAQTVVNQISHSGVFAGGCAYDAINDQVWVFDQGSLQVLDGTITAYDRSTGAQNAAINAPFPAPVGGFVDLTTGNIWIGDESEMVYEIDQSGVLKFSFSTLPTVKDVTALTWDPSTDTLWVVDDTASTLFEFTKGGIFTGSMIDVSSISPDPDGAAFNIVSRTFFLGDDSTNTVYEVDFAGTPLNTWPLGSISPEGLDFGPAGALFIATGNAPLAVFEVFGIIPSIVPNVTYCTAKTGLVCGTPAISSFGSPSAFALNGFFILAGPARSNQSGLILYTNSGRNSQPFLGGTLCINTSPLRRAPATNSGGFSTCDGEFSMDMNAFASGNTGGNPAAFLSVPANMINVQWWGRDSVATGSFLSDALEYFVGL